MKASTKKVIPKKRGRPATGKDPLVSTRMPSALTSAIDAWASEQEDEPGRSEAVRRLVELGLNAKAHQSRGRDMPDSLPDPWVIDLIDRATYLKGRFLTSYAQCEFLLADISVKIDARFIYPLKDRIKAVKSISEREGPFNQYADEVLSVTEGLLLYSDMRHFLAHGFMIFTSDLAKNHQFEFRRYEPLKGSFELHIWKISMTEMEAAAAAINSHCEEFIGLFQRIYIEQGIEKEFRELF